MESVWIMPHRVALGPGDLSLSQKSPLFLGEPGVIITETHTPFTAIYLPASHSSRPGEAGVNRGKPREGPVKQPVPLQSLRQQTHGPFPSWFVSGWDAWASEEDLQ